MHARQTFKIFSCLNPSGLTNGILRLISPKPWEVRCDLLPSEADIDSEWLTQRRGGTGSFENKVYNHDTVVILWCIKAINLYTGYAWWYIPHTDLYSYVCIYLMSLKLLMPKKCKVLDNIFISSEHNHHSSTVENENSKGECWWSFRMWNLNIFLTHFSTKINLLSTHLPGSAEELGMHTHHWHEACHPAADLVIPNSERRKIYRSIDHHYSSLIHFDVQLFGPTSLSTMEICCWVTGANESTVPP